MKAHSFVLLLTILSGGTLPTVNADSPDPVDLFLGEFQGHSTDDSAGVLTIHDIGVRIARSEEGFTVEWKTVTPDASGKLDRSEYSVKFVPTRREHIFASAMAPNLFGKEVPLNPLEGEPFMWARIVGRTLSIYAMFVTELGGHDMQIYERTLTEDGMRIRIQRLRDEMPFRVVTGTLNKTR
jgi:hypothetical protein